ncbi:MAG: hypothetical protein ABSF61_05630 [Anaerolineales bacterium]|jgi:hypothetical protein
MNSHRRSVGQRMAWGKAVPALLLFLGLILLGLVASLVYVLVRGKVG